MTYKGTRSTDAKQAFGSSECEGHWMSTLRLPLGPRVSSPSPSPCPNPNPNPNPNSNPNPNRNPNPNP